jgi:hypothetical protein
MTVAILTILEPGTLAIWPPPGGPISFRPAPRSAPRESGKHALPVRLARRSDGKEVVLKTTDTRIAIMLISLTLNRSTVF